MNSSRTVLALGLFTGLLLGCEKDGPAEEAGEAMDNAGEKMGDKMEEAGDKMHDATH